MSQMGHRQAGEARLLLGDGDFTVRQGLIEKYTEYVMRKIVFFPNIQKNILYTVDVDLQLNI